MKTLISSDTDNEEDGKLNPDDGRDIAHYTPEGVCALSPEREPARLRLPKGEQHRMLARSAAYAALSVREHPHAPQSRASQPRTPGTV